MSISATSPFSASFASRIDVSVHRLDKPLQAQESSSIEAQFLAEAKKTPAERIQEAMLKKFGVTAEEFANMEPTKKAAIQEAIKQEIIRQLQDKSGDEQQGFFADFTA